MKIFEEPRVALGMVVHLLIPILARQADGSLNWRLLVLHSDNDTVSTNKSLIFSHKKEVILIV